MLPVARCPHSTNVRWLTRGHNVTADWNEKEQVSLAGLDEAGVEKVFEQLTKKGETMPRSPESLDMVKLPTIMD